jgi:hypothetical protein
VVLSLGWADRRDAASQASYLLRGTRPDGITARWVWRRQSAEVAIVGLPVGNRAQHIRAIEIDLSLGILTNDDSLDQAS